MQQYPASMYTGLSKKKLQMNKVMKRDWRPTVYIIMIILIHSIWTYHTSKGT